MFQFSHSHSGDHEYCEACGQRLPRDGYGYGGPKKHNRAGIAVSILVHVLVLVYALFMPKEKITLKPPAKEGELVYISPLPKSKPAPTPKPKLETKPIEAARAKPQPRRDSRAITKAAPPKLETFVPPVQATMQPPTPVQEEDMQARVEAARKRRADANPQPQQEPQESDNDRALRVARANIMGAQGRNAAGEREDTGGVFSIINKSSLSADIKFRGFSANFKRQWSQQVHVELGSELDIETAIVKRMIELIRKEKPGEFQWESHRLGRVVPMNAGRQYQAELEAFLLKEFFPNYRR
ncbi:hypothetical protein [Pseudoduganella namucuonensis]|uniref:Uncharacterized protein n=1 Tax=Pseudoduganella namucuonensis TaxID=1035707 RepID=A0A1I7KEM7_9BURK|nr:hypothetical protein [Pseudoduganella namucuonensis]SFU95912.1 hypothetical protein SAMN05216552_1016120 [Pseudoduganella namucuonensis]